MPVKRQKKTDDIDTLYDSFEHKDMSRLAFRQAIKRLTDEGLLSRDLQRIQTQKVVQKLHRN